MQGAQSRLRERIENLSIDIRHCEARKRDYIDTKLGELKDQLQVFFAFIILKAAASKSIIFEAQN